MPAPGKRPDEPGGRAIRLTPGRPDPSRTGLGGVCGAWATSWGPAPRPCAAGIRQGVRVGRRRPARHHHRGGPAHQGAGEGGPRVEAGQRDPAERVGLSMAAQCERPSR